MNHWLAVLESVHTTLTKGIEEHIIRENIEDNNSHQAKPEPMDGPQPSPTNGKT
jgi:hypothetical protein